MELKIKIKKLNSDAIVPKYIHVGDAGMDVYAVSRFEADKFIEYGTGLAFEVPEGYAMLVFSRSSISNKDLILANGVGVLDSNYRGELKLRFKKIGDDVYEIGERIGQVIIIPYPFIKFEEVDELNESNRGEGGFGSSGKC